ncbi:MAG: AraC family transcriptional regulator [Clostridiales bacterium]|nr:AraC family transcriptional regulator [Clostridiales bacterium]
MYFEPERRFLQADAIEVVSLMQGNIPPHQHAFFELAYIMDGQAVHVLGGKSMHVKKGNYFIINYDEEHCYNLIHQQPFQLINILFKAELLDQSFKNCKDFQQLINHYLIQINTNLLHQKPTNMLFFDTDGSIYKIIRRIQEEYEKQDNGYVALIRCYIIEMIIRTLRRICKNTVSVTNYDCVRYIKDYVDKNYMNPITLSDICKELNFSLPYLSQKFKQETGYTFVNYLQQKRMEHSGRLIANTDKKISEIAGLAGYADLKFFNAVFKKHWGVTPTAFRKSYR